MILFIIAVIGLLAGITISVGGSLTELLQLLAGVGIGYYVLSVRLRNKTNVRVNSALNWMYPSPVTAGKKQFPAKATVVEPIKFEDKQGKVIIDESEFNRMIAGNPDLKKAQK